MDAKIAENALRELITAMENGRDDAVTRSPMLRRDYDTAVEAARRVLENLRAQRIEAALNLWTNNTALKGICRRLYDEETSRVAAALE
jgi:hypothetical protein